MSEFERVAGMVVMLIGGVLVLALLSALPVMWLWNWIVSDLFHLARIDVFRAWGLVVLCAILFKSSSASRSKS